MVAIPVCCVTGRIAGDSDACGDCDPCLAAYTVPDVVRRLLAEKDEWRNKYSQAMCELDDLRSVAHLVYGFIRDELWGVAQILSPGNGYWHPMETAPKDGSRFLARNKFGEIYHCHWSVGGEGEIDCWWNEQADDEASPKWWAPALPDPDFA